MKNPSRTRAFLAADNRILAQTVAELESKLAQAQQEIARLERAICPDGSVTESHALAALAAAYHQDSEDLDKAEALAAELARALSKYGEHAKDCAAWCNEDDPEYTSFWMSIYGGAAFFHPERACTCWRSTLLADPRVQALLKENTP